MCVRVPSVRYPYSFYDVFSVVAAAVAIMALVLAVRYDSVVRLELAVFMTVVFLWAGRAIERFLTEAEDRPRQQRRRNRPWK
ncbi:hypothetical protein HTG_00255 [Natrinema mahii]|nr:hypothetical protein HTG_00255 [Natrinema mahii]